MTKNDIMEKALAETLAQVTVSMSRDYNYSVEPIERKDIPIPPPSDWFGIYNDLKTGEYFVIRATPKAKA